MRNWLLTIAASLSACGTLAGATTFTKDVAPIIYKSCVPCHHPGEPALFSLLQYEDAKKHASQIVRVTKSGYMPPWLPDSEPSPRRFAGEQRLSAAELATLERWVKEGAPEGSHADLPKAPTLAAGWQFGEPDLMITAPQPFLLPPDGPDVYRNFVLSVPFTGTRYVRAVQIRPGAQGVVHHANLLIDRTRSLRWRNGRDGQPGFPGMDVEIPASISDPESHFLFWKRGSVVSPGPPGMAWTLEAGSDLILNVHLKPSGKPEQIRPSIGLYFTQERPQALPILVQLENDRALNIAPGVRDFLVTDEFTLPVDVDLLAVYPHAHYLGRDVRATAILPDGSQQGLIHIRRWDINWQGVYRYVKPLPLPKGTRVVMRWSYDNSVENGANPSHPPKQVTAGDQATDEMAHLWLQVLPHGDGNQRVVIQEAVARKRLLKDPTDFGAHFNLGGILQERQDSEGAIAELRAAVGIRPRDAVALNTLGALLQLRNQPDEAMPLYRRALKSQPDYADAHYNLAGMLLDAGNDDEAILHLREVVRLENEDEKARERLADALDARARRLATSGRLKEAIADFQDVVGLRPQDSNAHTNLGVALAKQGDLTGAKGSLERSLALNPGNAVARQNLERVKQRLR